MYDKNNIFAKIINKELDARIVFEDEKLIAFHDIYPKAPIHVLVIPKGEYTDYSEFVKGASKEDIAYFFTKLSEIAHDLCGDNYRICSNIGAESGQVIFHFHMHILGGKKLGGLIGE